MILFLLRRVDEGIHVHRFCHFGIKVHIANEIFIQLNIFTLLTNAISTSSLQPTFQPTIQPTIQPTFQPTAQPTRSPTYRSSFQPSGQPTMQPSSQPSRQPTEQPTESPTSQPTTHPTTQPTIQPTRMPSSQPTLFLPSSQPSIQPTRQPTAQPTYHPTHPKDETIIEVNSTNYPQNAFVSSFCPAGTAFDSYTCENGYGPSRSNDFLSENWPWICSPDYCDCNSVTIFCYVINHSEVPTPLPSPVPTAHPSIHTESPSQPLFMSTKPPSKKVPKKPKSKGNGDMIVDSTSYTISVKKKTTKESSYFKDYKHLRKYED